MRGSEKAVHMTFEIYLESGHFSSSSTTSVPPGIISHLYVSCRLLAPTLVSAAQKPEGIFKDKSIIMLLGGSSSPYHLGRGIQSPHHELKALCGLRPLPHLLKTSSPSVPSLLLTLLQPDWPPCSSWDKSRALPLAGPLYLLCIPSGLPVSAQISH